MFMYVWLGLKRTRIGNLNNLKSSYLWLVKLLIYAIVYYFVSILNLGCGFLALGLK